MAVFYSSSRISLMGQTPVGWLEDPSPHNETWCFSFSWGTLTLGEMFLMVKIRACLSLSFLGIMWLGGEMMRCVADVSYSPSSWCFYFFYDVLSCDNNGYSGSNRITLLFSQLHVIGTFLLGEV